MTWFQWPDRASFDQWHEAACAAAGLPRPGRNAATGEVDSDAAWTVALVDGQEQDDGTVIADVPAEWGLVRPASAVVVDPPPEPSP